MLEKLSNWIIQKPWVAIISIILLVIVGLSIAPFIQKNSILPLQPISIDALPNLGENQQIVYTPWPGHSPEEIEDRITRPLSRYLLGTTGLKALRSNSMLGFSSIYLIFEDAEGFEQCRNRILQKLSSLPKDLLPPKTQASIGPEATALGQVFWYTLESTTENEVVTNAWGLQELRTIQDFYIKDHLLSVPGIAEVSSIGGFVKEFQIILQPEKQKSLGIGLQEIVQAVQRSNIAKGAHTIEINKAEYFVRGLGYLENIEDLKHCYLKTVNGTPILLRDVAKVQIGNAYRRGLLEKNGQEAVGGIIVAQFGANPYQVIKDIKQKIREISPGLPKKTLANGSTAQIKIQSYYDRSTLIEKSINHLGETILLEVLITALVVVWFISSWKVALLVCITLPISILTTFCLMYSFNIDANIASLAGIGITIGIIVDLAIIQTEHIYQNINSSTQNIFSKIKERATEIRPVVLIAGTTTLISFLPLFALQGAEGKLFTPLVFTKSFALGAALLIVVFLIPALCYYLIQATNGKSLHPLAKWGICLSLFLSICFIWQPLKASGFANFIFVLFLFGVFLSLFQTVFQFHQKLLQFLLKWRYPFIGLLLICFFGAFSILRNTPRSFLPPLNEGSFLLMPSSLPQVGFEENKAMLFLLDEALSNIPEIDYVVGKLGKSDSSLDPAPITMFENLIAYKEEFIINEEGQKIQQWRNHIHSEEDIWKEIIGVLRQIPGLTIPPRLQPIETRLLMLQTGTQAPISIKLKGNNLDSLNTFTSLIENFLKNIPEINSSSIISEKTNQKPYLDCIINQNQSTRYGWNSEQILTHFQAALAGISVGEIYDGREKYNIQIKYANNWSEDIATLKKLPIIKNKDQWTDLEYVADLNYRTGPQSIKSEDGFLVNHVFFLPKPGINLNQLAENIDNKLREHINSNRIKIPNNTSYNVSGTYLDQQRAFKVISIIITLAILIIIGILFLQFKKISPVLMIGSGIISAFSGGCMFLYLFQQSWWLNFNPLGLNLQGLFHITPIDLNLGIWVGFLVLFGIATDDGVLIMSYLKKLNPKAKKLSKSEMNNLLGEALQKRILPALITTATTAFAMLPILINNEANSFMYTMAVPILGGALFQLLNIFTIPVLYSFWLEKNERNEI